MVTYSIYILRDPRDKAVRYVGMTTQSPHSRYSAHLSNLSEKGHNPEKSAWVKGLRAIGLVPRMEVIEELSYSKEEFAELYRARVEAQHKKIPRNFTTPHDRERYWIKHYKGQGYKLFNKLSQAEKNFIPKDIVINTITTQTHNNRNNPSQLLHQVIGAIKSGGDTKIYINELEALAKKLEQSS